MYKRQYQVREITLDMAPNMEQIARICFPAAKRVTDRFHVQKVACLLYTSHMYFRQTVLNG